MDYVTVRELRDKAGKIWQRVASGEEFVVTRNGKPIALLVHTEPTAVEERLRTLRLQSFRQAWDALGRWAQAGGAADMIDDEVQAEIKAARNERRRAAGRS